MKVAAISSLTEAYKLLSDDLQYSCLFWLGHAYFNLGAYDMAYYNWKSYFTNEEIITNPIYYSKLAEIKRLTTKEIEILCESFMIFKNNLKKLKLLNQHMFFSENKYHHNSISFSRLNYPYSIDVEDEISNHSITDYLGDWNRLKSYEPNIKFNYTTTYEYYRGLVLFLVEGKLENALEVFVTIINHNKTFFPAIKAAWKILKIKCTDPQIILNLSLLAVKLTHSPEVKSDDWTQAYCLYAKALVINKKLNEALEVLRNMLDIFAIINNEEFKYLNEISKVNKKSATSHFVDLEFSLLFYSKYHVYSKCESIFMKNFKPRKAENIPKINIPEPINEEEYCEMIKKLAVEKREEKTNRSKVSYYMDISPRNNLNISGISNYLYNNNDEEVQFNRDIDIKDFNVDLNMSIDNNIKNDLEDNLNEVKQLDELNESYKIEDQNPNNDSEIKHDDQEFKIHISNIKDNKLMNDFNESNLNNLDTKRELYEEQIKNKTQELSKSSSNNNKENSNNTLNRNRESKIGSSSNFLLGNYDSLDEHICKKIGEINITQDNMCKKHNIIYYFIIY